MIGNSQSKSSPSRLYDLEMDIDEVMNVVLVVELLMRLEKVVVLLAPPPMESRAFKGG